MKKSPVVKEKVIALLFMMGSVSQASAAATTTAVVTIPGKATATATTAAIQVTAAPTIASQTTTSASPQCVLGALICSRPDLQPYLVTTLWLLVLAVLLLVFERSEKPHCMGGSPSEPSSAVFGSGSAFAAAAKARERSRRLRAFCGKFFIQGVKDYLPTSCLQILLGLVFSGLVQISGYHVTHLEEIQPNLFFRFLLPIIIINAGLGVEKSHFFFNLPAILAYAVLGTLVVALGIGYAIYGLAAMNPGPFTLLKNVTKIEALTFGALISAVDPVSVLVVFERMNLNKPLYITLFGESFLNDAVSVILYSMFTKANSTMPANATEWRPTAPEFVGIALYSIHVVISSMVIGAACSFMSSGLLRVLPHAGNQHLAVIIVLVFSYTSFYLAEIISASGILSAFICSIVMSIYFANLTPISFAFLRQSTKSYAEISEGFTYLVLGVSALNMLFNSSSKAIVDVPFILITIFLCLVLRFACVYGIGYLLKALHLTDLTAGDFFILAYGGLRGANALSLSLMLGTSHHRFSDVFLTCTMVTVLLTCFIYGITLKPLIRAFKIQADDGDDALFRQIKNGAADPLKHRPLTKRIYHWSNRINNRYLKRALLKSKVHLNKNLADSSLHVCTESDSLDVMSSTTSSIYVIRKGRSRGSLSHGLSSSPDDEFMADGTNPADKPGMTRRRGNPSQSSNQPSSRPQVQANSRLGRSPQLPGRRTFQPAPPPLQNSIGAYANGGYRADDAGGTLEAASPKVGGNHRMAKKHNNYADQGSDLNPKAGSPSSPASNNKPNKMGNDDPELQMPRGRETDV